MMISIVSCLWAIVAPITEVVLARELVGSLFGGVGSSMVKSDMEMCGE